VVDGVVGVVVDVVVAVVVVVDAWGRKMRMMRIHG